MNVAIIVKEEEEVERKQIHDKSRVYLGTEISRWDEVKLQNNLKSDREVAAFLIDR